MTLLTFSTSRLSLSRKCKIHNFPRFCNLFCNNSGFLHRIDEECADDGFTLKPKALHTWLTRVLYNRRNKFDPLWNTFVVAGIEENGEAFLGAVDKIGTAYRDSKIATGYGSHLALPLMRQALERNPDMKQDEARTLLMDCLRVLYYRDTHALNKVLPLYSLSRKNVISFFFSFQHQIAVITKDGVQIESGIVLDTNWNMASMVSGYECGH